MNKFYVKKLLYTRLVMVRRLLAVNSPMMGYTKPLDWKGLLLATICTVGLLNGLTHLSDQPALGTGLLAIGLISLVIFIVYQLRAEHGLMNMTLFRYRQFAMGALVAFIYGAGLFGSTYLLPVYMQMALEYAPSQAGIILLPAGIVLGVTIMLAGRLADRFSPYILVAIGLSLLAASLALMAVGAMAGYFTLMILAVVGRIGLGFVLPSLSLGAMRGLEFNLIAQGASTINFIRQLGGAIGVSLVGIMLQWRLAVHHTGLDGHAGGERVAAFGETFLFVALLCALAVAAAWHMRPADSSVQ